MIRIRSPSNVLREAQNFGVKVTSEKTFLTFDEAIYGKSKTANPADGSRYHNKRRFTTTDLVMNKEIVEKLRTIGMDPAKMVGEVDRENETVYNIVSTDDDFRRNSVCSQITMDLEAEAWKFSDLPSLFAQPPHASSSLILSALAEDNTASNTTVMIRNIPNRYTQDSLISFLRGLGFNFNFFYCPIDRQSRANCGYFFVNLLTHEMADNFMGTFQGLQLPAYRSNKVCEACWARVQGYSANLDHYQDSPLAQLPREFRPRIFKPDGSEVPIARQERRMDQLKLKKVFVGGLSPRTTAETVRQHLSQFGEVEDVSVILDSSNRASRGFAFVTFEEAASVHLCVEAKASHFIEGRSVGIRPYSACKA